MNIRRRLQCHKTSTKSYWFLAAVVLAAVTLHMKYRKMSLPVEKYYEQLDPVYFNYTWQNATPKTIVWYMLYHGGLRMDSRRADMNQCEYKNCRISFIDNDMHYNEYFANADAIIFQGGRLPKKAPVRANNRQVYIFASIESPLHLQVTHGGRSNSWHDTINWTMTYRQDSDILYKYGAVVPKSHLSVHANKKKNYSEIYHNKTKGVAWLVSDCKTESKREKFVNKLRQYINVDIYGKCGSFKNCTKEEGLKCMTTIANDYKFYLSFENSICRDYITEKVFFWFQTDIINIVRGARTYEKSLPPRTYIDTSQFKSIKNLAEFLKKLGQNEEGYIEYLKNKSEYTINDGYVQYQRAYCDICKRLHNLDLYRKTYKNINTWWTKDACSKVIGDLL